MTKQKTPNPERHMTLRLWCWECNHRFVGRFSVNTEDIHCPECHSKNVRTGPAKRSKNFGNQPLDLTAQRGYDSYPEDGKKVLEPEEIETDDTS